MMSEASRWKAQMRARLAAARSSLLVQLLGLPAPLLEGEVVDEGLTPAQVLLVINQEDEARAAAIERVLAGADAGGDWPELYPKEGVAFSIALERFLSARAALLSALARIPDEDLFRPLTDGGTTVADWAQECLEHDEISADRLAEWRGSRQQADEIGPGDLLVAGMRAARKELLTVIALIPEEERSGWFYGGRILPETLRELSRFEQGLLTDLRAGEVAGVSEGQETAGTREATWRTLHDTHHALVRTVERLPEPELARTIAWPGSDERRIYDRIRLAITQDRQAAAALRTSLEVSSPGSRASP